MNIISWIALTALFVSILVNLYQAHSKADKMHEDIGRIKANLDQILTNTATKGDLSEEISKIRLDIVRLEAKVDQLINKAGA